MKMMSTLLQTGVTITLAGQRNGGMAERDGQMGQLEVVAVVVGLRGNGERQGEETVGGGGRPIQSQARRACWRRARP